MVVVHIVPCLSYGTYSVLLTQYPDTVGDKLAYKSKPINQYGLVPF
jgi:hypothetical protein